MPQTAVPSLLESLQRFPSAIWRWFTWTRIQTSRHQRSGTSLTDGLEASELVSWFSADGCVLEAGGGPNLRQPPGGEDAVMEFGVRTQDHSQTRGSAKTATNNKNRKGATVSRRRRTG